MLMAVALVLLSCGQPAASEALSSFLEGIGLTDIEAPLAGMFMPPVAQFAAGVRLGD